MTDPVLASLVQRRIRLNSLAKTLRAATDDLAEIGQAPEAAAVRAVAQRLIQPGLPTGPPETELPDG